MIAGLLAGIVTAIIIIVGAVLLLPEPPATVDASPTAVASQSAEPTELVTASSLPAVREDEGTVASFVQSVNASFPVGLDTTGSTAQAWDAVALPVHFWIDRDGIIRAGALGRIGPDAVATNLQVIVPDTTVTP